MDNRKMKKIQSVHCPNSSNTQQQVSDAPLQKEKCAAKRLEDGVQRVEPRPRPWPRSHSARMYAHMQVHPHAQWERVAKQQQHVLLQVKHGATNVILPPDIITR